LIGAAVALATVEQRGVLTLRFLVSLAGAAIDAERIAALAIALLDHLAAVERADAFRRRRDRFLRLADAAAEQTNKKR